MEFNVCKQCMYHISYEIVLGIINDHGLWLYSLGTDCTYTNCTDLLMNIKTSLSVKISLTGSISLQIVCMHKFIGSLVLRTHLYSSC